MANTHSLYVANVTGPSRLVDAPPGEMQDTQANGGTSRASRNLNYELRWWMERDGASKQTTHEL